MKKYIILIICIVQSVLSFTQNRNFCGFNNNGFYTQKYGYITIVEEEDIYDESKIKETIYRMLDAINTNTYIKIIIQTQKENCFAFTQDGNKIICANPEFLSETNEKVGTNWAAVSILAHEIGHLISNFSKEKSILEAELDADYWSGFILNKLECPLKESTKCIMEVGTIEDTKSHPNKFKRKNVIIEGWKDAKDGYIDTSRCSDCY